MEHLFAGKLEVLWVLVVVKHGLKTFVGWGWVLKKCGFQGFWVLLACNFLELSLALLCLAWQLLELGVKGLCCLCGFVFDFELALVVLDQSVWKIISQVLVRDKEVILWFFWLYLEEQMLPRVYFCLFGGFGAIHIDNFGMGGFGLWAH